MKAQVAFGIILVMAVILLTDAAGLKAESRRNLIKRKETLVMSPLTVNHSNPRYFTDGSGKAIYLTGSHTWNNFQDIGYGNDAPFNYIAYLDSIQKYNHNFIRMWSWEHAAWFPTAKRKIVFSPMAYERTGPGDSLDGKPKFDLNRFNQAYFDRLRARVIAAQERGIYVSVMLFQGASFAIDEDYADSWFIKNLKRVILKMGLEIRDVQENKPWRGHPFNVKNNINGINGDPHESGDGFAVHTLNIPQITKLQEGYVKKVIDTLNDLENVIWEISNESLPDSKCWQSHLIDMVHEYEEGKGKQHPVLLTVQYPDGDNEFLFKSRAEAISPNKKGGYKDDPPAADGRKIIISDTDHLWGVGGDYRWVWKSFLRGLNPIFMDPYRANVLQHPPGSYDPDSREWELIRKNMGYTLIFANRMNLVRMFPRPDLASFGYCLAEPGEEYLLYTAQKDEVHVDLSQASGDLNVEWFNPSTGASKRGDAVTGGTLRSFTSPFSGDAVLYLSRLLK